MVAPYGNGDVILVCHSNNKAVGVAGEQRPLTSDLTEKLARPEMTRARLATCARRGEQQTAMAWPRLR